MVERIGLPRNFDKLRYVPVFAVRDILQTILPDETGLHGKTGDELIALAEKTPEVNENVIEALFEEYRYGGRVSFYLYLLDGDLALEKTPSIEIWEDRLDTILTGDIGENNTAENVAICDIEFLEHGLVEIRYKYEREYRFINPADEMPDAVGELHFGFIWLNLANQYLVLMSKHEEINPIIEQLVAEVTGLFVSPIKLTKSFINRHFTLEHIRSVAWQEPRTGLSRRLSGEDLLDTMGDEFRLHDAQSQRKSSLYDEPIDDEITSRLGITLSKGKIYLTRTLPASTLRKWMYTRLDHLLLALKELQPAEKILVVAKPILHLGISSPRGEEYFRHIVGGVLIKRENQLSDERMPDRDNAVYASLRDFFNEPEAFFDCEQCDETSPVCCPECGHNGMQTFQYGLKCSFCGKVLAGRDAQVSCLRGHTSSYLYPETSLVLRPNYRLQQLVADYIYELGASFNPDEEFFWIEAGQLHYTRNSSQVVYLPADLAEFAQLPRRDEIPSNVWEIAWTTVASLNEKCQIELPDHSGQPRRQDCEECFANNLPRLCSPKLFRALAPRFMPLPHGGYEFGDVGLAVTIEGRPHEFIGIVKSGTGRQVNMGSDLADEIIRQVIRQAIKDNRVEAFGIILPRPLSEELRATVTLLAKMARKKVIFWGHEDLARLCAALILDPSHHLLLNLVGLS